MMQRGGVLPRMLNMQPGANVKQDFLGAQILACGQYGAVYPELRQFGYPARSGRAPVHQPHALL